MSIDDTPYFKPLDKEYYWSEYRVIEFIENKTLWRGIYLVVFDSRCNLVEYSEYPAMAVATAIEGLQFHLSKISAAFNKPVLREKDFPAKPFRSKFYD